MGNDEQGEWEAIQPKCHQIEKKTLRTQYESNECWKKKYK